MYTNKVVAKNKTTANSSSVIDFLSSLEDQTQRRDSEALINIMQTISGEKPVMWGSSIIGFGSYHYKYDSGREGDSPQIGFSPRKGKMSIYITGDASKYIKELDAMGKYKVGKGCIYIKKLSDVDVSKLTKLIEKIYVLKITAKET